MLESAWRASFCPTREMTMFAGAVERYEIEILMGLIVAPFSGDPRDPFFSGPFNPAEGFAVGGPVVPVEGALQRLTRSHIPRM